MLPPSPKSNNKPIHVPPKRLLTCNWLHGVISQKTNLDNRRCENLKSDKANVSIIIIISGVRLSPLGNAAITDLLYQPQMMMIVVQLVE
jgi:hypothetical protein